jgi:hypothetical protein
MSSPPHSICSPEPSASCTCSPSNKTGSQLIAAILTANANRPRSQHCLMPRSKTRKPAHPRRPAYAQRRGGRGIRMVPRPTEAVAETRSPARAARRTWPLLRATTRLWAIRTLTAGESTSVHRLAEHMLDFLECRCHPFPCPSDPFPRTYQVFFCHSPSFASPISLLLDVP